MGNVINDCIGYMHKTPCNSEDNPYYGNPYNLHSSVRKKIKYLCCSYQNIIDIPSDLINLIFLDCSKTRITNIPATLTKLEELHCCSNQITSIPATLTNLVLLSCSTNKITSIPANLTKLKELNCSFNKITSIPTTLINLEILTCWGNPKIYIPHTFINLHSYNIPNIYDYEKYSRLEIEKINRRILHNHFEKILSIDIVRLLLTYIYI